MGDMADYFKEQELYDEFNNNDRRIITRASKWLTKSGELIKIRDMSTEHIINCVGLLNTKIGWDDWIAAFSRELEKRQRI